MLCRQCSTINPDRCSNCLECHAPLSQANVAVVTSNSTKKPSRSIEQNIINTEIISDVISFNQPKYFTTREKLRSFALAMTPTLFMVCFFTFEIFALFFDLVPLEILLLIKIISVVIYAGAHYGFYPFFDGYTAAERYFGNYGEGHLVQISFAPRRYRGWEGFLDDGDDIGILRLSPGHLHFHGDGGKFVLTRADIAAIKFIKKGRRGGWMLGSLIYCELNYPLAGIKGIYLHTNRGTTIFQARSANRAIITAFQNAFPDRIR